MKTIVFGTLNSRICFHDVPGVNLYWVECVCVAFLKESPVLNGILFSKLICIQNSIMLNGTLWDDYGVLLLPYINILVQLTLVI